MLKLGTYKNSGHTYLLSFTNCEVFTQKYFSHQFIVRLFVPATMLIISRLMEFQPTLAILS